MDMFTYQLNEGSISLPRHWLDQSMNIFVLPNEERSNFVINRIDIPVGVENEEYYAQILDQFRHNLKDYQELHYETLSLNEHLSHLLQYQYLAPEGKINQLTLLHIVNNKLLTLTFSSKKAISPSQRNHILHIMLSFKPATAETH